MTEPIAVDVPPKPAAGAASKPATGAARPEPAKAAAKFAAPKPPAGGGGSFLQRFARNKLGIGAAAVFSLAAGIAGFRLLWPDNDAAPQPDTAARQPASGDAKEPGALPKPTVRQEGLPPPETIAPQVLPVVPVVGGPAAPPPTPPDPAIPATPPAALPPIRPVAGEPIAPPAARDGDAHPMLPAALAAAQTIASAVPAGRGAAPRGDGFVGLPRPPATTDVPPIPPTLDTTPVVPAAGAQPPKKDDTPPLPALPGTPQIEPKADPVPKVDPTPVPKIDPGAVGLPMPPAGGGVALPMPKEKEPVKVQGEPVAPVLPKPPAGGGMNSGMTPTGAPPVEPDLGAPAAPAIPPAKLPDPPAGAGGGTRMDFTKPAGGATASPATDRQPTTTYDEDIYAPKAGDSWESISREFYGDARLASALSRYNGGQLAKGRAVNVPPIHVVRKYAPATGTTPAGGFGAASAADWGAATPPARPGGEKKFVIPTGGMSMRGVARLALGSEQRWSDIYNLNPHLKPDEILPAGTELQLPPDARNP